MVVDSSDTLFLIGGVTVDTTARSEPRQCSLILSVGTCDSKKATLTCVAAASSTYRDLKDLYVFQVPAASPCF